MIESTAMAGTFHILRVWRERLNEWRDDRLFRLWRDEWRERRGY